MLLLLLVMADPFWYDDVVVDGGLMGPAQYYSQESPVHNWIRGCVCAEEGSFVLLRQFLL